MLNGTVDRILSEKETKTRKTLFPTNSVAKTMKKVLKLDKGLHIIASHAYTVTCVPLSVCSLAQIVVFFFSSFMKCLSLTNLFKSRWDIERQEQRQWQEWENKLTVAFKLSPFRTMLLTYEVEARRQMTRQSHDTALHNIACRERNRPNLPVFLYYYCYMSRRLLLVLYPTLQCSV